MRLSLILICLVGATIHALAQSPDATQEWLSCGTEEHHIYRMKNDADYRARYLRTRHVLDSLKRVPADIKRRAAQEVTIPVVVHVIHLGEPIGQQSNIPDEQILGAIDGLNERYANANGVGEDMEIRFCLATRDPFGCPTSGINRVDGSVVPGYREEGVTWDGSCGVEDRLLKDLSKWPTWTYYNIWVVHDICGSIAGYAYYPNGDEYDGTVIDIASMRYDNLTLAHELGHGLNIRHTFSGDGDGDCPVNDDCADDGDAICDTPPHRVSDCGFNNPCSSEGVWANSYRNWMSYCFPPNEEGRFTVDQRTRMWDALAVEPRSALLTSEGCANAEGLRITSDASILCPQEARQLSAQPAGGHFEIAAGSGYIDGDSLYATGGALITLAYVIETEDCVSTVYQDIPVKSVPGLRLNSAADSLCVGEMTLLQGIPSGGTYGLVGGPGDVQGQQLTALEQGMIEVYYQRTLVGCVLRDTLAVAALNPPIVEIEQWADDVLVAGVAADTVQWVRCDLGYSPVPEATGSVLAVTETGEYAVVAIQGTCRDTSACVTVELTSTDEGTDAPRYRVFPNPVTDVCYLDGFPADGRSVFRLVDASGARLAPVMRRDGARWTIDMSALFPGVYVLYVQVRDQGSHAFKLIKG
jgi:hypothetical protein